MILPWGQTSIAMSPTGLRECVLRVQYIGRSDTLTIADQQGTSLLQRVARWKLYEPQKWAELVALMNVNVGPWALREES